MSSLRQLLPLAFIILLGFFLRIHALEAVPLRGDEAFSAQYWSDMPLTRSLAEIAPLDPHPPLTFALFRLWRQVLGGIESVFSLRLLSALGNTLGIAAMYGLAAAVIGSRGAGLIAALMWALHPYEIWHSQDYRNYALWACLSVSALWLGLRLLLRRRRVDWLAYGLAALAAAMIFYTELFNVAALGVAVTLLAGRDRAFILRFLSLQLLIALAVAVSFALLQARAGFVGAYGGNLEAFGASDYLTRFLPTLTFGEVIPARFPAAWPALTLVYALAALLVWMRARRQFLALLPLIGLPMLLIGLASLGRDVFNPRYVLNAAPAFTLLLIAGACAAERLPKAFRVNRAALSLLVLSPWFALAAMSLQAYYNDPAFRKAPAWDELGEFLSGRVEAEDLVIQLSVDPAFAYYYDGSAPELALPASPRQKEREIVAALERLRGSYRSVFVAGSEQAGWANAGVVEGWMRDNLQALLRTRTGQLPIRQYAPWRVERADKPEIARFGQIVALLGHEFFPEPLPTGELLLWIDWRPLARSDAALKSFVHVYGAVKTATGSALWTQADQFPQEGRLDAASWRPGEAFRDVYYLPASHLAPGDYQIHVGWYDAVTGERLALMDGGDSYALASWTRRPAPP